MQTLFVGLALVCSMHVATASVPMQKLAGVPTGVTLFVVPTPNTNGLHTLSGGVVMDQPSGDVFYGGGNAVLRVSFPADHSTAALQEVVSLASVIQPTYNQYLVTPAPFDATHHGIAWFSSGRGGQGGGLIGVNATTSTLLEADYLPGMRVNGAVGTAQSGIPYLVLDEVVYKRDPEYSTRLKRIAPLPSSSNSYDKDTFGSVPHSVMQMHGAYIYANSFAQHPDDEHTWMVVNRLNVHTGVNSTLWVQQLSTSSPVAITNMFFDNSTLYLVMVNCELASPITPSTPFCQTQTSDSASLLSFDSTTAFLEPSHSRSRQKVICPQLLPSPRPAVVDEHRHSVYLQCGHATWSRISLITPSPTVFNWCEYPAGDASSLSQLPRQVPASGQLPFGATNAGSAEYNQAANWVGWLELSNLNWQPGMCTSAMATWWIWMLAAIVLLGAGALLYRSKWCKHRCRQSGSNQPHLPYETVPDRYP